MGERRPRHIRLGSGSACSDRTKKTADRSAAHVRWAPLHILLRTQLIESPSTGLDRTALGLEGELAFAPGRSCHCRTRTALTGPGRTGIGLELAQALALVRSR